MRHYKNDSQIFFDEKGPYIWRKSFTTKNGRKIQQGKNYKIHLKHLVA